MVRRRDVAQALHARRFRSVQEVAPRLRRATACAAPDAPWRRVRGVASAARTTPSTRAETGSCRAPRAGSRRAAPSTAVSRPTHARRPITPSCLTPPDTSPETAPNGSAAPALRGAARRDEARRPAPGARLCVRGGCVSMAAARGRDVHALPRRDPYGRDIRRHRQRGLTTSPARPRASRTRGHPGIRSPAPRAPDACCRTAAARRLGGIGDCVHAPRGADDWNRARRRVVGRGADEGSRNPREGSS